MRSHPNFGGIAWHGYGGNVQKQTEIHNKYPQLDAFQTELPQALKEQGGTPMAEPGSAISSART